MKKTILTTLFVAAAFALQAGDGTVLMRNQVNNGFDAPVFDVDGSRVSGTNFKAGLYAGPEGTAESALQFMGPLAVFRTGTGAGYFIDGTRTINNLTVNGGVATVQIRAFDIRKSDGSTAADWDSATTRGKSNVFTVDTADPNNAQETPAEFANMQSFQLQVVPEPTTIGLGLLGVGSLLLRRRKANATA